MEQLYHEKHQHILNNNIKHWNYSVPQVQKTYNVN